MTTTTDKKGIYGVLYEVIGFVAAIGFSAAQYVMLEYSCNRGKTIGECLAGKDDKFVLLNILALFVLTLIIRLIAGKWGRTLMISSALITIWSIANYFTLLYHGAPLFPSELMSAGTAMEVMGDYSYEIDHIVKRLIITGAILLVISAVFTFLERKGRSYTVFRTILTAAGIFAGSAVLYNMLFSPTKILPGVIVGWKWEEGVDKFGFVVTAMDNAEKIIHAITEPEGYSAEKVREYECEGVAAAVTEYPDIILILNESYYNMDNFVKTGADADYMEGFYGHDNAIYGYSAVSHVGGGTNNSEFELFTGNSMALLNSYAPFNYYNFSTYKDDFVHYLKELGYSTTAMHQSRAENYKRNIVYPQLGFDEVVLGKESFEHSEFKYGKRKVTDSNNYKDLFDHYNAQGDGPRFMYLLTMQNHGGYEKNDDDLDVVHVSEDFGEYTDDMNEYLSTVSYSSKAFSELIGYYSEVDRPVIICMTGDHAPSFISMLKTDKYSAGERTTRSLLVPYVIWSNFGLDTTGINTQITTHFELTTMVFKMAGLPLTPYQKTILDLHDEVPALTKIGSCIDRDGNFVEKSQLGPQDLINKYYYLEYNTLKHDGGYREEMFRLP